MIRNPNTIRNENTMVSAVNDNRKIMPRFRTALEFFVCAGYVVLGGARSLDHGIFRLIGLPWRIANSHEYCKLEEVL